MKKTRILFPYNLKRWSGRIKSQIYKDINIFSKILNKNCKLFCRPIKIGSPGIQFVTIAPLNFADISKNQEKLGYY